jgi:hypothetical protein
MATSRIVNLANFQQFAAINILADPGYDPVNRTIPNCVQIVTSWALGDGKIAHNVMHGTVPAGFTPTPAIALAIHTGLVTGGAWTALAGFLAPTESLATTSLRDIRTLNQPEIFPSGQPSGPGTSASPALPNEVAVAISLHTGFAGRAFRGRLYVPGWATNALGAGNVVAAGAITALNAWANTIPSVLSGQGIAFALGQHARVAYTGATGSPHAKRDATTIPIISQSARDNHWDSQRRRGLK